MSNLVAPLAALVVLSQTPAPPPATPPPEARGSGPIRIEPLPVRRIHVPADADGPLSVSVEVPLYDSLLKAAGPDGIGWDPRPAPRDALRRVGGADAPGPAGRVGVATKGEKDAAPLVVEFTRPKIKAGEPGRLILTVVDPAALRAEVGAGVFRGELPLKLSHPSIHEGVPFDLPLPLELVVDGRRLVGIEFLEAPGGKPLRVGQGASLSVEVETVGVELGSGWLELELVPAGKSVAERLVRVPLPLPDAPWDPAEPREGWSCHPLWAHDAVRAAAPSSVASAQGVPVVRHQVPVQLPDLPQPGEARGRVVWHVGPGPPVPADRLDFGPVPVLSGLSVSTHLAFVDEPVQVRAAFGLDVATGGSAPDEVTARVAGPPGAGPAVVLKRAGPGVGFVSYSGEFRPHQEGAYHLALDPGAAGGAAAGAVVEVNASVRMKARLPRETPLIVFVGSPPLWWDLVASPADGARHVVSRADALAIRLMTKDEAGMRLRLTGVYHDEKGRLGSPIEPGPDPAVRVAPRGEVPAAGGKRAWDLPSQRTLTFDLTTDITKEATGVDPSRRALGTEPLLLRWMLSGADANGRPVAKIFHQRFRVRVASEWEYYMKWAWVPVSVLLVIVFWLGIYYFGMKMPSPKAPALAATADPGWSLGAEDQGYLGGEAHGFGSNGPGTGQDEVGAPVADAPPPPRDPEPAPGREGSYLGGDDFGASEGGTQYL